jgi:hypothetical protein
VAGLGMKDRNVIEFVRNSFSPSRRINYDGKIYRILFPISNNYLDFLTTWGCIKRKSLTLKPTDKLIDMADDQFYQMLVGIIEGDGSIMIKTKCIRIYSGSYEFCRYIVDRIGFGRVCSYSRSDIKHPNTSFWCVWSYKQARVLSRLLLNSKIMKMDRKWNVAKKWLQDDQLKLQNDRFKVERASDIILHCKSPKDDSTFSEKWKLSILTVRNIRIRRRWKKLRKQLESVSSQL